MRKRILQIREHLLTTPDSVCLERARLATEGDRLFADDPTPVRRAKTFGHILDHMTLDLDTNPVFAGNMSTGPRAWMLLPEYGFGIPSQALVENPALEHHLDGDTVPGDIRAYWKNRQWGWEASIGHVAIDAERLLNKGLDGIIREAESCPGASDSSQGLYRQACAITCRAVARWACRYAEAAEQRAVTEGDPELAACHRRVARACRRVPTEPPRDLFEALQSLALVHFAIQIEGHGYSVSPGRLDQVLRPFQSDDPDTTELLAAFLLKLNGNALWGSHSKTQTITVAGADGEGNDQSNPLTLAFLEACELACVPEPVIFLRWHASLQEAVKRKATKMLVSGHSLPILIGDTQTVQGLVHGGIAAEDAENYCVIGCNELGVPGKLIWDSVVLHEASLLSDFLQNGRLSDVASMDDVLEALAKRAESGLRDQIEHKLRMRPWVAERVPTPFTSALMDGCIERGKDLYESLRYDHINVRSSGFTNLINSLAAIDVTVFRERRVSLRQLAEAVAGDFAHAEGLRAALLAAPKWGNDDDAADQWAERWVTLREDVLRRLQAQGCPPLLMEMVTRSLHHLDGGNAGATADGRHAGEPFADSLGPQVGTGHAGPTAILNSVRKVNPARFWTGGYNLNLTLPLTSRPTATLLGNIEALIEAFFADGGQELQINALSAEVLSQARHRPEKHGNLMVRVAGFNAFFVRLGPAEQEEIVLRAKAEG